MSYKHLTVNERYHIRAYLSAGYKKKELAKNNMILSSYLLIWKSILDWLQTLYTALQEKRLMKIIW